jgi:hypothetical protein
MLVGMNDAQAERLISALESIASSLRSTAPGSNGAEVTVVNAVGEMVMQLIDIRKAIENIPSGADEG